MRILHKTATVTLIIMLCCISYLYSQESSKKFITVSGYIKDARTGKPLPYSTVFLLKTTISNISNAEGYFTLKIPIEFTNDSLRASFIGYSGNNIAVQELLNAKKPIIKLFASTLNLKPTYVRPEDAATIFRMAYNRIKQNYREKPVGMTGFYRETIKRGNQYMILNEAILDIFKASYTSSLQRDQIAIYKGRGNQNYKMTDTLMMKLQGGPISSLYIDIVKNPFAGADLVMAQECYSFTLESPIYKDGRTILVLSFNQKPDITDILYRGKLYIDNESLAIIRAEFSMNVENKPFAWKEFVMHKPDNVKVGVEYATYVVNFKEYSGKWYFDYSRLELKFNIKYSNKWLKNRYTVVTELAATNINENTSKIEPKRRLKWRDIMSSKVNDFTDREFWEGYNIIEPDESIENIISKIIKQLNKRAEQQM
jgi:hypothetical protein